MEFIMKITITERLEEDQIEKAKKHFNDPDHMSKLKAYQVNALKQAFAFEDNMELEITYELKEDSLDER